MIRQPVVAIVGHIDHGKSSVLESFKHITITNQEAGGITQTIKSYSLPMEDIQRVCKDLMKGKDFSLPGLLFLDTPGHAAFNNMRKRGGNLADIAILIVDINEGLMPQTLESIEILKTYKTPFIIALNKIDKIYGWKIQKEKNLLQSLASQPDSVKKVFDERFYALVGTLFEKGFQTERFDRVEDFTKQIAMIPCSAKTGEGIPELLMMLVGLAQRFLEQNLDIDINTPGHGTLLEVKEEKGLGTVLDVVLYDGKIKKGDQIIIGGLDKPIVTKIRGLFKFEKGRPKAINEAHAAAGVKIVAPDIKEAVSGMPLLVANENLEEAEEKIMSELEEVLIETDNEGIVLKADSLGSLEALIGLLQEKNIMIKKASVGSITKKDLADASAEEEPLNKVILAFNVPSVDGGDVKIIAHEVIYKIIEDYEKWIEDEKKRQEAKQLDNMVKPAKIKIIKGCIFRQSNPCVAGVKIIAGTLTNDVELIKANGNKAGYIKSMQAEKKSLNKAEKGKEIAVSIPGVTAGRQVDEEDILFVNVPEKDFKAYKKMKKLLSQEEVEILKELAEIKRKDHPVWGV